MKDFIVSIPFRIIKVIVTFLFHASVVSLISIPFILGGIMTQSTNPIWWVILYVITIYLSKHYLIPYLKTKFSMQSIHRFILMVGSFLSLLILLFGIYGGIYGMYVFLWIALILILINVLAFRTNWNI